MAFEGHSIFSVLEGFYQHFLVPKRVETTLEWGSRSATMTLINLSVRGWDTLPLEGRQLTGRTSELITPSSRSWSSLEGL